MSSDNLPRVVEGKVIYVSPITSFFYKDGNTGFVQRFLISDILAEEGPSKFKVVIWNKLVGENLLQLHSYYRFSDFKTQWNQYPNLPEDQSRHEIHIKKRSSVEEIPFIGQFLGHAPA